MTEKLAQPTGDFLDAFVDVSAAVESGAGLPEVARATERALGATIAVVDRAGTVLAVAAQSPDDERTVLSGTRGPEGLGLRVAEEGVGELRFPPRGAPPPPALVRGGGTRGSEAGWPRGRRGTSPAARRSRSTAGSSVACRATRSRWPSAGPQVIPSTCRAPEWRPSSPRTWRRPSGAGSWRSRKPGP